MPNWLVKTEPDEYSIADLAAEGTTVWDGVRNHLALRHMRSMHPGDQVLIYHTGRERAIVGLGVVARGAYHHPDDGSIVVDISYVGKLGQPISLTFIKSQPEFAAWELVRQPRLSVMPVPDEWYAAVLAWRTPDIDVY